MRWLLLLLLLAGCPTGGPSPFSSSDGDDDDAADDDDATGPSPDADEDGFTADVDCDDADALVWPGAPELCDAVDNDCDDVVDEDVVERNWWPDADGDGYGADGDPVQDCARLDGHAPQPGDCDDGNENIHPGAFIDGVDADCDGRTEWMVTVQIAVDDRYELCVDDEDNLIGLGNDWQTAQTYYLFLDEGPHAIGFRGWSTDGITTGAIVDLWISTGQHWWTNENWRYDPQPDLDDTTRIGWCNPDFDDAEWAGAWSYQPWGAPPWGFLPAEMEGTAASWIWDDELLAKQRQYFRFVFTLPPG